MSHGLPDGWTIDRVRAMEPRAEVLNPSGHDIFVGDGKDFEQLTAPTCILNFSGLCLVRVEDDDEWWMGDLDESDGSIVCWSSYGPDLELAIRGL